MAYTKSIIAFLAFLLLLILPLATHAAACDLSAEVKALAEIQATPVADYLEDVRLELQARKELLSSTLACLIAETEELKSKAEKLQDIEETLPIKKELARRIQDALAYLERQKNQIPNLGIQGTKNMAQELKTWRGDSYARLQNETDNLNIWNGNQTLFETAGKRLEQINQTVRLLKLLENDEIRSMYEKSEVSLRNAGDLHRRALQNIKEYRSEEEISYSLKTSLEALSQTYKNFLDLSQAVKKILPL